MQNLKKILADKGKTVTWLSNELDLTPQAVYTACRKTPYSVAQAIDIADLLGVTLDELVGRNPPNQNEHMMHRIIVRQNALLGTLKQQIDKHIMRDEL